MKQSTKFILTFFAGFCTCGISVFIFLYIFISSMVDCVSEHTSSLPSLEATELNKESDDTNKIEMFEKPRNVIAGKSFRVLRVQANGNAIAMVDGIGSENFGLKVLFISNESTSFYDNQKITIPKGKVAKQVGIYRDVPKIDYRETLPIVEIMDK